MKLPDFYAFEPFNKLKESMGIPRNVYGSLEVQISSARLTPYELELLTSGAGIDVGLDEVQIHADGTLIYKDSRVLLYIRDVHRYADKVSLPRYHVANCTTLRHMRETGRSERYLVAARIDGTFSLNIFNPNKARKDERLDVCQNCLVALEFDGFRGDMRGAERKSRVRSFTPARFFEKYPRSLHISTYRHESSAPINEYPKDWDRISRNVRERAQWKCQEIGCGDDLSALYLRGFLEVHHRNGDRSDNAPRNLIALCIECHGKQPWHAHVKSTPRYLEFQRLKYNKRRQL